MKRCIFAIPLGIIFTISCGVKDKIEVCGSNNEMTTLTVSSNADYLPHKEYQTFNGDYDKYLEFFEGTDYEIGISSSKDGGLPGGSNISCISGVSQIRKAIETKSDISLPQIRAFVNELEISQQNIISTRSSNSIMDCFGKVVKFSFCTDSQTRNSDCSTGEADMYVPKAIEFTFPHAESEEDLNPLCYYKNFVIRWNKDEDNKNGILVIVDWTGSMVLGNDIPDTHVCRVANFPDTGEALIPENFFDGIPDTAYCDLMILRGNIENIEQGLYTYKLVGKTHHQISFILIREIENKRQEL